MTCRGAQAAAAGCMMSEAMRTSSGHRCGQAGSGTPPARLLALWQLGNAVVGLCRPHVALGRGCLPRVLRLEDLHICGGQRGGSYGHVAGSSSMRTLTTARQRSCQQAGCRAPQGSARASMPCGRPMAGRPGGAPFMSTPPHLDTDGALLEVQIECLLGRRLPRLGKHKRLRGAALRVCRAARAGAERGAVGVDHARGC